jgi:cell division protein FtsZ
MAEESSLRKVSMNQTAELFENKDSMIICDADQRGAVRIVVIGIGGAGCNMIDRMIETGVKGVELVAANTDVQALRSSRAPVRLELGMKLTRGLGCGGDAQLGRKAALEETERILNLVQGSDIVFIAGGAGGGTFTGAAPVFAALTSEIGALTVAMATMPFSFQGKKRCDCAETGVRELKEAADALIVIPNECLLSVLDQNVLLEDSLHLADDILCRAVQGISEIIMQPGIINIDLSDVRTAMQHRGMILMGQGMATGPNRALDAAQSAISNPLLDGMPIMAAKTVLVNVSGSRNNLRLHEAKAAAALVKEKTGVEDLIFGATYDDSLGESLKVTVIAAGLTQPENSKACPDEKAENLFAAPMLKVEGSRNWEDLDRPAFGRRRAG